MQVSGPVKEDTVTVTKIATVERREVGVPVTRRAAPQRVPDEDRSAFRRSAPLTLVRDKKEGRRPGAVKQPRRDDACL